MYSKRQGGIRRKAMKGGFFPMMGAMGNPMEMLQKFNPLNMLMGKGLVQPQYEYQGGSLVHPQYQYQGGALVQPQQKYQGGNFLDFFNPAKSPMAPWNWGGGQVGGKRKRAPSARGQKVAQLMRSQGMTLGEASKYLKSMGQ